MRVPGSICRSNKALIATIIAVAAIVIATVWRVDPEGAVWMPKCTIKLLTGYDCPGCGATRALHAALHGNFAAALRYNFFLIAGLGYALLVGAATWIPQLRAHEKLRRAALGRRAAWIYITLFFVWWVARNILGI